MHLHAGSPTDSKPKQEEEEEVRLLLAVAESLRVTYSPNRLS